MLGKFGRQELDGSVGGIAGMFLKKREGFFKRASHHSFRKNFVDNWTGMDVGGDESGCAVLNSRAQTGAAHFHRKEELRSGSVGELSTEKKSEGRELEGVKIFVGGEEVRGIAGAEAVVEFE